MSAINWGDAPTWLGVVFAAAAAGAAVWTLKSQRDQIGEQRDFIGEQRRLIAEQSDTMTLERAELRANAEERRVSQARRVTMTFATAGSSGTGVYNNSTGYDRWHVNVVNGSDAPVHDVMVRFGAPYLAVAAWDPDAVRHPDRGRRGVPVHLIGASRSMVFESPSWTEESVDNNRPSLHFTDDDGAKWRLDEHGKLEELPSPPGPP
ncbi:hypothetical protein [Streptomyces liliifuscus]|uniref:Uncharacterized protein n=1 Tax=Streptomyces liliifuscus TaxID=2797636 RepID=A0A7T7I6S6_9ACTN|nr:hypothetical protein [Streptomyces liliifuscus]QQM41977.1 hypothetical protein JEQ17_22715 [Streptomyces liliifuscus]